MKRLIYTSVENAKGTTLPAIVPFAKTDIVCLKTSQGC
jgi:hypothetical protein